MITMEPQQEVRTEQPRVNAHGHLALLDWERTHEEETTMTTLTTLTTAGDPVRHSAFDRIFDGGLILLIVATVGAVGACLAHL